MSKSKGNVIGALETLEKYNDNAIRFYFLKDGPLDRDECFNAMQLVDSYNAHLVNEFANAVRRVSSPRFLPTGGQPLVLSKPITVREREFITKFNAKAGMDFL